MLASSNLSASEGFAQAASTQAWWFLVPRLELSGQADYTEDGTINHLDSWLGERGRATAYC
ncbi:hypothetical protein Thiosp_01790 [Thiorhodovibrio litoralis]|nr:hypothetical protein [Thiorhodovibrio winogradskyi]WPL12035.1 hypothetical protein Thiosp_01790 [Thiorhodovibrio litoralis]